MSSKSVHSVHHSSCGPLLPWSSPPQRCPLPEQPSSPAPHPMRCHSALNCRRISPEVLRRAILPTSFPSPVQMNHASSFPALPCLLRCSVGPSACQVIQPVHPASTSHSTSLTFFPPQKSTLPLTSYLSSHHSSHPC